MNLDECDPMFDEVIESFNETYDVNRDNLLKEIKLLECKYYVIGSFKELVKTLTNKTLKSIEAFERNYPEINVPLERTELIAEELMKIKNIEVMKMVLNGTIKL